MHLFAGAGKAKRIVKIESEKGRRTNRKKKKKKKKKDSKQGITIKTSKSRESLSINYVFGEENMAELMRWCH